MFYSSTTKSDNVRHNAQAMKPFSPHPLYAPTPRLHDYHTPNDSQIEHISISKIPLRMVWHCFLIVFAHATPLDHKVSSTNEVINLHILAMRAIHANIDSYIRRGLTFQMLCQGNSLLEERGCVRTALPLFLST